MEHPEIEYDPAIPDLGKLSIYLSIDQPTNLSISSYLKDGQLTTIPLSLYLFIYLYLVCLLLHFMKEGDCYTTVCCMLRQDSNNVVQYFTPTKKGITLFLHTFDDFIKKHIKKLFSRTYYPFPILSFYLFIYLPISINNTVIVSMNWSIYLPFVFSLLLSSLPTDMNKLNVNAHSFADSWFLRLFVGVFPFQTVLRIFDSFLSEGSKILYRVALGFLKLNQQEFLKCNSARELTAAIENRAKQCFDADSLMKVCIEIF